MLAAHQPPERSKDRGLHWFSGRQIPAGRSFILDILNRLIRLYFQTLFPYPPKMFIFSTYHRNLVLLAVTKNIYMLLHVSQVSCGLLPSHSSRTTCFPPHRTASVQLCGLSLPHSSSSTRLYLSWRTTRLHGLPGLLPVWDDSYHYLSPQTSTAHAPSRLLLPEAFAIARFMCISYDFFSSSISRTLD